MAINKKTLRKLTRDFIVPLGKRNAEPLSMFHEVTQSDRKLECPIIRQKKGRKKK